MKTMLKITQGRLWRSAFCVLLIPALFSSNLPASGAPLGNPVMQAQPEPNPDPLPLPATRTQMSQTDLRSIRLLVNGQLHGRIMVLPVSGGSEEQTMVPIRTVMEAVGWKVVSELIHEGAPVPGSGSSSTEVTPSVSVTAPYLVEVQHQDMSPAERGQKEHPGFFMSIKTGYSLVHSPDLSMGEELVARPLPQRVAGRVYVPAKFLEEAVRTLAHSGLQIKYVSARKELQITYTRPVSKAVAN